MQAVLLTIHVLLAIGVIGLVLIQQGKGADAGAAFGSGSSATVFGAGGSGSFLTRMTTLLAALFFATSIALAVYAANRGGDSGSVVDTATPSGAQQGERAQGEGGGTGAASGQDQDRSQSGGPNGDMPPIEQ